PITVVAGVNRSATPLAAHHITCTLSLRWRYNNNMEARRRLVMKSLFRLLGLLVIAGIALVVYRALRQESSTPTSSTTPAAGKLSISPDLMAILVDPGDKGPIELMSDTEGREWLVNRRNGFRYPVENGIPVMLISEGEKHRDESLITG
ncbi:MAG: Trm112 family protein, partial [Bacteroidota bacterium]